MRGLTPATVAALCVVAAADVAIVAGIAVAEGTDGVGATVVALVLAPIGVFAVARLGSRIAGARFAVATAVVFSVLPLAAPLYFYGPFLHVYRSRVMPELVGLRSPWWFGVGIAVAVVASLASARLTALLGIGSAVVALAFWGGDSWAGLYANFHESTWSPTLLSMLPFVCVIAIALRSPSLAAALGGWLAALVLWGASRPYGGGAFWLSLAPAMPAVAVVLTSFGLLVPRMQRAPLAAERADAR